MASDGPFAYHLEVEGDQYFVFNSDGRYLASGVSGGGTGIWDTSSGKLVSQMGPGSARTFSPDSRYLATHGGWEKPVHVWSIPAGVEVAELGVSWATGDALAFSPDGRYLVVGADEKVVLVFHAPAGPEVRESHASCSSTSGALVAFLRNRDEFAVSPEEGSGQIQIWSLSQGRHIKSLLAAGKRVVAMACDEVGSRLACVLADGPLLTMDAKDGTILAIGRETHQSGGWTETCVRWISGTDDIVAGSFDRGGLVVMNAQSGHLRRLERSNKYTEFVTGVAITSDGRQAAVAYLDGIDIYDVVSGERIAAPRFEDHGSIRIGRISFDPGGRYLAFAEEKGPITVLKRRAVWLAGS